VTVQVGQCGNQLGFDFFAALARESGREVEDESALRPQPLHQHISTLFRETPRSRGRDGGRSCCSTARAVLLDAEPRVIANVAARAAPSAPLSQQWQYTDTAEELQRVWKSVGASGSANNWAFGYYRQGEALGACALEMVRKEAEHCDRLSGFLFFQSLSGGTGSGAGSRISELLRDEYPCSFMMHAAVWPSRRSEVVVQSYNAVLSLAHLLESTDALLALHNDEAHDICQRRLDIARPSLSHLNSVLAGCVAELWLPSSPLPLSPTDPLPEPACPEMGDVVGTLCPSPLHKIVSVRSAPYISLSALPFSSHRWDGTLRTLRQMALTSWHLDEELDWHVSPDPAAAAAAGRGSGLGGPDRAVAHALYLRGVDWHGADVSLFRLPSLYAPWLPHLPFSVVGSARQSRGLKRSAVLLSNSQGAASKLDTILHTATNLRAADAYLHQYRKFGLSDAHLDLSLASLEQVASDYHNL